MTHTPEQIRAAVERYEARKYDCPASSAEELGRFAATALPELLGEVERLKARNENSKNVSRQKAAKQAAEIERLNAESGVAERSESELCKIIDEREAEIERLEEELKDLGHELREVQER